MKIGSIAAMILVTVFAVAVMLASGTKLFTPKEPAKQEVEQQQKKVAAPAPVSVMQVSKQPIEILQRYSGMIRPLERLTLGFEIPGRIDRLGENANGQIFDDGVRAAKGDVLAVLDTRELEARKAEAEALLAQAQQEMDRAVALRQKNKLAISDVDFLNRETALRINEARAKLAAEQLRNATLIAPADGVISKRMLAAGESVSSHQPVFELIQVDEVLLVVGVPEAKIRPLIQRYKEIKRLREVGATAVKTFRAYVELVGRDAFGNRWDRIDGVVRTISETADDSTGLFEVEIAISNLDGTLRPGQIAVAKIVANEIEGFSVPSTAAIFQAGQGCIYRVETGSATGPKAARFWLQEGQYLEQEDQLIILDLPEDARQVVVEGQHRLAPGRSVRVVPGKPSEDSQDGSDKSESSRVAG